MITLTQLNGEALHVLRAWVISFRKPYAFETPEHAAGGTRIELSGATYIVKEDVRLVLQLMEEHK